VWAVWLKAPGGVVSPESRQVSRGTESREEPGQVPARRLAGVCQPGGLRGLSKPEGPGGRSQVGTGMTPLQIQEGPYDFSGWGRLNQLLEAGGGLKSLLSKPGPWTGLCAGEATHTRSARVLAACSTTSWLSLLSDGGMPSAMLPEDRVDEADERP
jgi:hypothetical protein